jgi:glycosyltransferase involved in cell wall biosynthesis
MNYIVIPAYNEGARIGRVITQVKSHCQNIIVIDDGSEDDTVEVAKEKGVKVLKHMINLGKGAALKTGCDYAYKIGAQKIVVIDSDGQHNPKEIPLFLHGLEENDIVFGYRTIPKEMPGVLKFGNWFINKSVSIMFNIKIKDSQSGYRAFTREAYPKIRWEASDYYMETEMVIRSGKKKLRYLQLPIETIYGDRYKGTTVLDGVKIVTKMFVARLTK